MSIVQHLFAFGIRQVVDPAIADSAGALKRYFSDHSQTLPKALAKANDRAWQAIGVALAGDRFMDRVKLLFASGDDKGIREQVTTFLNENRFGFEGSPVEFRQKCLVELQAARHKGLLTIAATSNEAIADEAMTLRRYSDPHSLAEGAHELVGRMASELRTDHPNLAALIGKRPDAGPLLLVAAFGYFFRREVECNEELAHGLFLDSLKQLSSAHAKSFGEVHKAFESLGDELDRLFEQLGRIETTVLETKTTVVATHGVVLDLKAELDRQGNQSQELRGLLTEVLAKINETGLRGDVKPQHSFSIRSDGERQAVKQLLDRFRRLPPETQHDLPALQNGLGKLLFGSGEFESAQEQFEAGSKHVADRAAQAELQHNAFRAALESRRWAEALTALVQAASLESGYAPFPLQRYEPRRILGAGGFGTAFLCFDKFFKTEVVVKTLHAGSMERDVENVFEEARILSDLRHPGVIGVRDCSFADSNTSSRPFIVMDYFAGTSLEAFVEERGCLSWEQLQIVATQIAEAMQAAHAKRILHRDLKPANVLVRKEGDRWAVKVIDFGLAMRRETIETSIAARSAGKTILAESVAGTVKYAPPEQMGKLKGVRPGPYSDVYAFGKLCFFALFRTTEPKNRHLDAIPREMARLLEACTDHDLAHRIPSFEAVLSALGKQQVESLVPSAGAAIARVEATVAHEVAEEIPSAIAVNSEVQAAPLDGPTGESELSRLVTGILERSRSLASENDQAAIEGLCRTYRIASERASEILDAGRGSWERVQGHDSQVSHASEALAWLYHAKGVQHGPVSESALRMLIASGTLTDQDYVWKQGMNDWATVKSVLADLGMGKVIRQQARFIIEVAGSNQVVDVAAKSLRGIMSFAREGLAGLKPFSSEVLRFYLDGAFIGEGNASNESGATAHSTRDSSFLNAKRRCW
ncbi:MAG: protein kinase [Gemmataceae bacterium]|nr:protein kinase [Gemmataceae bacterium]